MERGQPLRGQGEQRLAGETPRLAFLGALQGGRAREGGVAHDEAVHPRLQRHLGHVGKARIVEVGGDLHQKRRAGRRIGNGLVARGQRPGDEGLHLHLGLERPEAGRVGRGDVAHEVVRQPAGGGDAEDVVLRRVLGLFVLPHIGADDAGLARRSARAEAGDEGVKALAVEAEAVDDPFVLVQAEQAWLAIARLGAGRHRARLHEAEAQGEDPVDGLGILVEAGGEPHRIGEIEPPEPGGKHRLVRA